MNKKLVVVFAICSIINSFMITPCHCDDEEEEVDLSELPRSCQKYLFDFVWGIFNSILKCLSGQSTFKVNRFPEYITRSPCLLKCTLQEEGIIDKETGKLDDIGAAFYFEETFAKPVRDIALPIAQGCFAYADNFVPNEYWCKSYVQFVECSFGAILKGLIPYAGDCVTTPVLGILFSVIKNLTPDSPSLEEDMEELRRSVANATRIKCMDKVCTKMYEYKKVNGTQSIVIYNKDMEVLSIENRKTKPKPKDVEKTSNTINNRAYYG